MNGNSICWIGFCPKRAHFRTDPVWKCEMHDFKSLKPRWIVLILFVRLVRICKICFCFLRRRKQPWPQSVRDYEYKFWRKLLILIVMAKNHDSYYVGLLCKLNAHLFEWLISLFHVKHENDMLVDRHNVFMHRFVLKDWCCC